MTLRLSVVTASVLMLGTATHGWSDTPLGRANELRRQPQTDGRVTNETIRRLPSRFTNSLGIEMTLIPGGTFQMGNINGSTPQDYGYAGASGFDTAYPVHEVELTPFYMSVSEVTEEQWRESSVAGGFIRAAGMGERMPVLMMYDHVIDFCEELTLLEQDSAMRGTYMPPSEAQWEYACRAGTGTEFHFGDEITEEDAIVDHDAATNVGYPYARPVRSFPPNAFGLYDMHGNAEEWCRDWYRDDFYSQPEASGVDPLSIEPDPDHPWRSVRGGSHMRGPHQATSWFRGKQSGHVTNSPRCGVRLVMIPAPPEEPEPEEESPTRRIEGIQQPVERVLPRPSAIPDQPVNPLPRPQPPRPDRRLPR